MKVKIIAAIGSSAHEFDRACSAAGNTVRRILGTGQGSA